jgi:hypothetical protein
LHFTQIIGEQSMREDLEEEEEEETEWGEEEEDAGLDEE